MACPGRELARVQFAQNGLCSDGFRLIRNNLPSGLRLPPTVSINLGPEVKAAYEPFVDTHGIIIRKREGHTGTGASTITSSTGGPFDAVMGPGPTGPGDFADAVRGCYF